MTPHQEPIHRPVLLHEVLAHLDPRPGETWVDATLGVGGHSRAIAEKLLPNGRLISLDQDATMIELARPRLADLPATLVNANFDQVKDVLENLGVAAVDGVLADLGFCSDQMDDTARGFSFQGDGPLDMRLDPDGGTTAADLVNTTGEAALADLIFEYGEERHSRKIARRIVERRKAQPFATTADLANVVKHSVPWGPDARRIHPATRTFQALRIAVNDELGALDRLLAVLPKLVRPGGRVGIISFHSLEDRRVKHAFRDRPEWQPITKKPVEATDAETAGNPRSRSAKLRVAKRVEG
ncbi:16S rRNA (cytosine(1402)-N(4))-methyltransferase RsmH [Limnoglobus roseus]|uniref:Ribosomal RNA small subunit methyltransferase H n=1 Tax=Limnoglobus roseus TaxID=2598579 RepID=A0A5C1AEH3_9BACT|nr:16S rRNA (cytosine(1402)-N(4))-methyltransferase RsmH [Limnoglobus roseus]QEL16132.1 16S rRNA (cytosine(1402)-N(4))-methyltransferase RsmH [Limnoglobus roseus]